MLQQNLEFLERLKENNNRDWFEANRKTYEATRKELIKFTELLLTQVRSFDASVDVQNPKDCLFRIYRDVRFSKNKAPYKTAMGVVIQKGGKKSPYGGYYFHIEPGHSFIGGGHYRPSKLVLDAIRRKIYFEYEQFLDIIKSEPFFNTFGSLRADDSLKRMPKWYEEDHPAAFYLKFKSFVFGHPLTDNQLKEPELAASLSRLLQPAMSFIDFINESIEESDLL
jgi:uncharacterized protein (TIGR02453 family)